MKKRWDIHAHWLPQVDDGAKSIYECAQMLRVTREIGLYGVCATPHIRHAADLARMRERFEQIKAPAQSKGLRVFLGGEINYRAIPEIPKEKLRDYCIAGTNCILIEFSTTTLLPRWDALICEWVAAGLNPIIAHPERYKYIQKDVQIAKDMVGYGCELQTSACHLEEGIFSPARRTALRLLEGGFTSYIASDAHNPKDYVTYARVYDKYREQWPCEGKLEKLLTAREEQGEPYPARA